VIAMVELQTWVVVLGLASLSVVSTSIGVVLALRLGTRPATQALGLGFSVGVMVAISVVELLPEAVREGGWPTTVSGALAGAAVLALLHLAIPHTHLVEENRGLGAGALRSAYLVAFGLILHDVPEGFAMANAYLSTPRLGVLVAVVIMLHNIPEEFAMAVPATMFGSRRFLRRAAVASAAAEPVGAMIGLAGVSVFPGLNAGFLAFAAGAMVYVSVHELLPMARQLGRHRDSARGVVAGAVALVGLQVLITP
jgi:ZIP family zinc transporter